MTRNIIRWRGWGALLVVAALLSTTAHADRREDYLIRLLRNSNAFRVRAQAALSLGQLERTPATVTALERATRDRHPAVRVSAISSLRQLGAKETLPTVRAAARDRNKAVRRAAAEAVRSLEAIGDRQRGPGRTRHLVAVGMPGAKAERVSRQMLFDARLFLSEKLVEIAGVELAPDDLSPADAKREIAQRKLHGYFLESSIVTLRPRGNGVRAEVSVIVLSYPSRNMRAMLRGAATASGTYSAGTAEQAIQGAIVGALRRLPQVMAAANARGSL
ncbi:MAG: HEAT repeat domain-containing protein [Myxococcota bacterium]